MGWYFRKSVSAGPFRFNFSKSGIGVSTGVRGLRVSAGPRGTYVTVGAGGIYYRQRLGGRRAAAYRPPTPPHHRQLADVQPPSLPQPEVITSTQMDLVDTTPDDFLQEFNRRASSGPWFTVGAVLLAICLFMAFGGSPDRNTVLTGLAIAVVVAAYIYDHKRRTTSITFELDSASQAAYDAVLNSFRELGRTQKLRKVLGYDRVQDGRYHAGAGQLLSEKPAGVRFGGIPYLKTIPDVPTIVAAEQRLVFLPDRMLLMNGRTARSFSYDDLKVSAADSTYIESGVLPSEARVVGHTWRFVNKNGSPDRRFNDNRQIPKVAYEFGRFVTPSGLEEVFYSSYPERLASVGRTLRQLALAHHPAATSARPSRVAQPAAPHPKPAIRPTQKTAVRPTQPRIQPVVLPPVPQTPVADGTPERSWSRLGITQDTLKQEINEIRAEKGYAWAYQIFARSLMQAVLRAAPVRNQWAGAGSARQPIAPRAFLDSLEARFDRVVEMTSNSHKIFNSERLAELNGEDEARALSTIASAAVEYQHLYEGLMRWSMEIRQQDLSHREGNQLRDEVADFTGPSTNTLEAFPLELRDQIDEIADAGHGELSLKLNLTTADAEHLLAAIRKLDKQLEVEGR